MLSTIYCKKVIYLTLQGRFPKLFEDPKAVELIKRLDYDFSDLEKKAKSKGCQFGALEVTMHETDLMTEMKD